MSKHSTRRSSRRIRPKRPASGAFLRRARFEALEPRMVLSTLLAPIGEQIVLAGAPLHVALDGFDDEGDVLSYEVSVSGDTGLRAEVLEGNRSLRMSVDGFGDMLIELFEGRAPDSTGRIIELAEAGFYDGLTFHRILETFMIQGGDPNGDGTGGSGVDFDDEFNLSLQHTSAGIFSMAKGYDDGNDSQFFITAGPTRSLDFNHSILGFLNDGDDVRQAIAAVDVELRPGSNPPEYSKPLNPVVITSVDVFVDEENGVLVLSAPEGTTGEMDVTVTVSDGNGGTDVKIFHVVVEADPTDNYPFLLPIDPVTTTQDTPVTFTLEAIDADGGAIFFYADDQSNPNLLCSVDSATGEVTITPSNGIVGVHEMLVAVRAIDPADSYGRDLWDLQMVPLYISPAAPSGVELVDAYDTGPDPDDLITSFNNAPGDPLQFLVSGVVSGAEVTLFIGGQAAGQAIVQAGADTVEISASAVAEIPDGVYGVTVGQVLRDQSVDVGNFQDTVDLASDLTTAVPLRIDTVDPTIVSEAELEAAEGRLYRYDVESDEEPGGGVTYCLLNAPAGMSIPNPANGKITWTPTAGQAGTHSVVVEAMDAAGNTTEQQYDVEVAAAPSIDAIDDREVDEGSLVSFTATASGGVGALVFSLDPGAPIDATIDPNTGEFNWTPGEEQGPAVRSIVVRVTDALGAAATETVNVTVREVNQAPSLNPIDDRTIDEGELLQFDLMGDDDDQPANPLLYALSGDVPDGASVDPSTGRFTWTPDESQGGESYLITATLRDPGSDPVEQTFTVTVNDLGDPGLFPGLSDITMTMLVEALQKNTGAGGSSETSNSAGDDDEENDPQVLALVGVSSPTGGLAPDGDTSNSSLGTGGSDAGAVGGSVLFGTDLDPGTGSGGGVYAGEQEELPTLGNELLPNDQEAPAGGSGEPLIPPLDDQSGDHGDADFVEVPEHLVALNDAALRSLAESEATGEAATSPELHAVSALTANFLFGY